MKLIGSMMILVASVGIAWSIHQDLENHLNLLYDIRSLLLEIDAQIQYTRQPVEAILKYHVKTQNKYLDTICQEISKDLMEKTGQDGALIWRNEFLRLKNQLNLTEEEMETAAACGGAFFGKSVEENTKNLDFYLERFDFLMDQNRREKKDKQKVYQAVSVMCGLMLIILLV